MALCVVLSDTCFTTFSDETDVFSCGLI